MEGRRGSVASERKSESGHEQDKEKGEEAVSETRSASEAHPDKSREMSDRSEKEAMIGSEVGAAPSEVIPLESEKKSDSRERSKDDSETRPDESEDKPEEVKEAASESGSEAVKETPSEGDVGLLRPVRSQPNMRAGLRVALLPRERSGGAGSKGNNTRDGGKQARTKMWS